VFPVSPVAPGCGGGVVGFGRSSATAVSALRSHVTSTGLDDVVLSTPHNHPPTDYWLISQQPISVSYMSRGGFRTFGKGEVRYF